MTRLFLYSFGRSVDDHQRVTISLSILLISVTTKPTVMQGCFLFRKKVLNAPKEFQFRMRKSTPLSDFFFVPCQRRSGRRQSVPFLVNNKSQFKCPFDSKSYF